MSETKQSKLDEILVDVGQLSEKERFELSRKLISMTGKNVESWKTSNDTLQEIPIPSPLWMKLRVAERKKDKKKYLRLSRPRQNLNISTRDELAGTLEALQTGAKILDWKKTDNIIDTKLLEEIKELKQADAKKKEQLREWANQSKTLRLQQLDMDIPRFKKDLSEFKEVFSKEHSELDLQKFLEKNIWLFGAEYLEQQPVYFSQFKIWDSKYDFFLQRYDTFYDIFEIKKADVSLFLYNQNTTKDLTSPARESPISGDLKDALSQMIRYLEDVNIFSNAILMREGISIHKPKGRILIGRSSRKDDKAVKTLNSYLNNIEILTYDDLYTKGQEFVKIIEKRRIRSGT